MAVIAMTQHPGTHAAELARMTAQRLGYRFLTADDLIAETSRRYHVTAEQLVIVDERRPHFWERLKTDTERFVAFFRAVVLKEMAKNQLVVIGRSVAHLMPDYGCGLRVRLTAPLKERVRTLAAEENLTAAIAERRVRDYDREIRARILTLFAVDIDDPGNYSLVLNTFAMPLPMGVAALTTLASEIDRTADAAQWRHFSDAAVTAEVRAALMVHPKIGHAPFEVECVGGAVQISGPGLVPPWDNLVNEVVRGVEGVTSVAVNAEEAPVPVRPG
jgi:cytidylate kinase